MPREEVFRGEMGKAGYGVGKLKGGRETSENQTTYNIVTTLYVYNYSEQ